jgi:GNAT superfamily N-acetyltransferase
VTPAVEVLAARHDLTRLDSGAAELDSWLERAAWQAHGRDTARVYVVSDRDGTVIAYSALVVATLSRRALSSRAASGLPAEVPAVLLAKLAVDRTQQGAGVGAALLRHAARQALEVRDRVGVRLLVAEARDEAARAWYTANGLTSLSDGRTCYVRLKDLSGPGAGPSAAPSL